VVYEATPGAAIAPICASYRRREPERTLLYRRFGLGHREATAQLAGHERHEPPLFLFRRAVLVQDLDVARVGRLTAEHKMPERRAAERFGDEPVLDQRQADAAEVARHLRRPQAELLTLARSARMAGSSPRTPPPLSISRSRGNTSRVRKSSMRPSSDFILSDRAKSIASPIGT
jgi:hypothetical protein